MFSTSRLLVEHLISGLLAVFSFGLLTFSFIDLESVGSLFSIQSNPVLTILGVALIYPLGILVDLAADRMLENKKTKLKNANLKGQKVLTLLLKLNNPMLNEFSSYITFKLRILRSSILNFALLAIFGFVFVISNEIELLGSALTTGIIVFLIISSLAFAFYKSWVSVTKTFYKTLNKTTLM